MLYFKMKRFLLYTTLSSRSSYSKAYNSYSVCDRSKLFAVFEWPVNCLSATCYFNIKYVFKKLSNETNRILMILQGVVENVT